MQSTIEDMMSATSKLGLDDVPSAPTVLPAEEWIKKFEEGIKKEPYRPQCLIALEVICESIRVDDSKTLHETLCRMKYVRDVLSNCPVAGVACVSSGELFTRFITRAYLEIDCAKSIDVVRDILVTRGQDFIRTLGESHHLVSKHATSLFNRLFGQFSIVFPECINVLTQGWSPSVCTTLIDAHKRGFAMHVFVMECRPRGQGPKMVEELRKGGVAASAFPDTALALFMQKSHFVFLAAEGLTLKGAVIGETGTSTICVVAKAMGKKVYVTAEIYRFTKILFCTNRLIANHNEFVIPVDESDENKAIDPDGSTYHLLQDFIHQKFIERIISDVGAMGVGEVEDYTANIFT